MFELISTVILSIMAIASPTLPYDYHSYTAKASSLNEAVLAVSAIPHPPEKSLVSDEIPENTANYDFGTSEGLKRNLASQNEEKNWIEDLIKQYSAQYSVSYEEMRRVMLCESSGKIDAVGDNGKAFGLFQFWENTFNLFAKDLGEKLEWKNPEHQIKLASYAFSVGKQTHWTCWKNM